MKNIKTKIINQITLILLIIFGFTMIVFFSMFYSSYKSGRDEIIRFNEMLLRQSNETYISGIVEDISEISVELFYNSIFWDRNNLQNLSSDKIYDVLANGLKSDKNINSIYLYSSASDMIFVMDQESFNDIPVKSTSSNLFKNVYSNISEYDWYSKSEAMRGQLVVTQSKDLRNGTNDLICFSRFLQYPLLSSDIHYAVSFNISAKTFSNVLSQICESEESLFLFDNEGEYVYGISNDDLKDTDPELIASSNNFENGVFTTRIKSNSYIVIKNTSNKTNWNMIKVIPEKKILGNVLKLYSLNFSIISIVFLTGFLILFSLLLHTVKPITKLSDTMSKYQKEEIEIDPVFFNRKDEIGTLYRSFQEMITYNNYLIESEYQSVVQEKQAKIEALQTQINPHFLYNTLQTISSIAIDREIEEIERITSLLSNMLRYNLNRDKGMVILSEELTNVNNYLEIQRFRFGDRISVTINLSEDTMQCYVPVFALQLPVENAIKHGLEEKIGNELIEIYDDSVENEFRRIFVKDNGVGIPTKSMKEINELFLGDESRITGKGFEHKGLRNLNLRLKYFFGNQYGVTLTNNETGGVIVMITIPYDTSKDNDAPGNNC